MRTGMAGLRLATTDMSARGTHAKAVAAAAFLARGPGRCGEGSRDVGAGGLRAAERSKPIHAAIVVRAGSPRCDEAHSAAFANAAGW